VHDRTHGRARIVRAMERKWWTLVSVCVAIFMLLLDITIVNVALPSIQSSLKASFSDLQWVVDAYALTLATCVLTAGSMSDLFGRKRIFAAGIVVFTIASAFCGAANDPLFLILARAVQGVGGAVMFATSLALISQEFHGKERGTAFGIWGATTGAAVAVGPLAGGILTSELSWRWIFLVNIPIGIVAVAITLTKLAESKDPEHGSIDPLGLVLLTGGIFSLVFALIEGNKRGWESGFILGFFALAVVSIAGLLVQQSRRAKPMLDVSLFRVPAFVGAQIGAFCLSASLFAMFLYLTLYIQDILNYSPLQAGLRFLPITLLAFFTAPIAGKLTAHAPVRLLMGGGLAVVALSMALMAHVKTSSHWTVLLAGFVVGGIGIGLVNPSLATTAISTVPREQAGVGSGINATFRQVGIATGIAALGAIFQHQQLAYDTAHANGQVGPVIGRTAAGFISGLNDILWVGTGVAAVGAVLAFALVRKQDFLPSGGPPAPAH
jgi:EmrB/QacA subfamily drug resistance transporter